MKRNPLPFHLILLCVFFAFIHCQQDVPPTETSTNTTHLNVEDKASAFAANVETAPENGVGGCEDVKSRPRRGRAERASSKIAAKVTDTLSKEGPAPLTYGGGGGVHGLIKNDSIAFEMTLIGEINPSACFEVHGDLYSNDFYIKIDSNMTHVILLNNNNEIDFGGIIMPASMGWRFDCRCGAYIETGEMHLDLVKRGDDVKVCHFK